MSFRPFGLRAALLSTFLVLAAPTGPVLAEPDATQKEAARNLMWSGDQLFDKGDHTRALQAYQAADAIMNVPTTGLAVAKAQAALGQLVQAHDKAVLVARSAPQAGESPVFAQARAAATELAAELSSRIPTLFLKVEGAPADAVLGVTVDGAQVQAAALAEGLRLNPTSHEIVVTGTGFEDAARTVKLAEGKSKTLTIALQRERVAATGPRASTVTMATGFSVGGVALIVGAVTGALSISQTDALLERCGGPRCPPDATDDLSSATMLADVSNGAFVIGGVGLAVGIVGVVLLATENDPPTTRSAEPDLLPRATARGLTWVFR